MLLRCHEPLTRNSRRVLYLQLHYEGWHVRTPCALGCYSPTGTKQSHCSIFSLISRRSVWIYCILSLVRSAFLFPLIHLFLLNRRVEDGWKAHDDDIRRSCSWKNSCTGLLTWYFFFATAFVFICQKHWAWAIGLQFWLSYSGDMMCNTENV